MYIVESADGKLHIFTKIELVKIFDGGLDSPDRIELSLDEFIDLLDEDKFKGMDNFLAIKINESSYTLNLDIAGESCMWSTSSTIDPYTIFKVTENIHINLENLCQMCLIHGYKKDLLNVTVRIPKNRE